MEIISHKSSNLIAHCSRPLQPPTRSPRLRTFMPFCAEYADNVLAIHAYVSSFANPPLPKPG